MGMTNEIGLREARKEIGPIANRAHLAGEITYLTRHGKAIAAVVPLDRIKEISVTTYAYRVDVTDDGETWMPYRDDARDSGVPATNPEQLAHLILASHLVDRASVGEDCDGTRVLVWRDTEGLDTEAVATAEYNA